MTNCMKFSSLLHPCILKKEVKPFTCGEFLKKTVSDCVEALFNGFKDNTDNVCML